MDIGQTISRTFGVVKERFGPLLGLWAVYFAIQLGLTMLFGVGMGASGVAGLAMGNPNAFTGGMLVVLFLFYLAYFLVYFAQMASMIAVASPLKRVDFGDAFSVGLRSAPTLLGVFVLFFIAYIVFVLAAALLGGLLSMAGSVGIGILLVLIIPAIIYLLCRVSVVNAVVAVDRVGNPVTAIARSWSMTQGKVLAIFAVLLIFGIVTILLFAAVFVPFFASISATMTSGAPPSFARFGLFFVGALVVGIVVTIAISALLAVIHGEVAGQSREDVGAVFG